ncbi:MAG: acyl-CoA reductase [Rhodothermales bacterium]
MIDQQALSHAIAEVASKWIEPTYPQRRSVVEDTLVLGNRFTEEAMSFAINQQMSLLNEGALLEWVNGRRVSDSQLIGVLNAGNIPLVGLQDWLAVVLTGAGYRGVLSSKSPFFLPAFALDVVDLYPDLDMDFVEYDPLFDQVDAVIASGGDETIAAVREKCIENDLSEKQCLLRGHRLSIALLTGNEGAADLENLAEDVLLHEGMGCRNVSIIWAPENVSPDPYLDAFAVFRSVFPVHTRTPGSLKMKQAFLAAVDTPHAYGEGMEFLVSKGAPEQQEPGHVRWAEYRTEKELISWIENHKDEIQLVLANKHTLNRFKNITELDIPDVLPLGDAQRPSLNWCADGIDTIAFLQAL